MTRVGPVLRVYEHSRVHKATYLANLAVLVYYVFTPSTPFAWALLNVGSLAACLALGEATYRREARQALEKANRVHAYWTAGKWAGEKGLQDQCPCMYCGRS